MIPNAPQQSVATIMTEHRALAVLRTLQGDDAHGSTNSAVLSDVLDAWGLGCTSAALRACLGHLEQSGLVTTTMANDVLVVQLTLRGMEVAIGKDRADGVLPHTVGCPY